MQTPNDLKRDTQNLKPAIITAIFIILFCCVFALIH